MGQFGLIDGIYHPSKGLPTELCPKGTMHVRYSHHALTESIDDCLLNPKLFPELSKIPTPNYIEFSEFEVRELRVENGVVTRVLVRKPVNRVLDVSYVINPSNGTVLTTWLNRWYDRHQHVDTTRYNNLPN